MAPPAPGSEHNGSGAQPLTDYYSPGCGNPRRPCLDLVGAANLIDEAAYMIAPSHADLGEHLIEVVAWLRDQAVHPQGYVCKRAEAGR